MRHTVPALVYRRESKDVMIPPPQPFNELCGLLIRDDLKTIFDMRYPKRDLHHVSASARCVQETPKA